MSKRLDECSKEELIDLIKQLKKRKKFGLIWEDKAEKVVEQCRLELPVLEQVENLTISAAENASTNLIVEGDNYHSLSVLNYTHGGKIDVIYIDPPYNTGARDWKYNNDYVDANDTYRHSKWLSFMRNRLVLSKSLLKEDGVLIVTIDDNELFRLGNLLEEIFPAHDIYIVTIEHNRRGRRGKNFAKTNEWALFVVPKGLDRIAEQKQEETIGGETRNLRRTGSGSKRSDRPKKFYPIWVNRKTLEVVRAGDPLPLEAPWKTEEEGDLITVWPIDEQGREKNWHYGIDRTRDCIEAGQLEARLQGYGMQVYYTLREKDSKKYKTVWTGSEFDASTHGSVLLETIFQEAGKFDYPKSLHAVVECLKATVIDRKDAVILDFFAGSGTTGHATMVLNKSDGGNRQFILCTNNENKIAEEVTYPRIRRTIQGYGATPGIPANVRYFKTAFVPRSEVSDDTRYQLVQRSCEMICVRENTFQRLHDEEKFKIYESQNLYTAILFDIDYKAKLLEILAKLGNKEVRLYVFSLTNDTYREDFAELKQAYTLCPIPESILEVYRKIFQS